MSKVRIAAVAIVGLLALGALGVFVVYPALTESEEEKAERLAQEAQDRGEECEAQVGEAMEAAQALDSKMGGAGLTYDEFTDEFNEVVVEVDQIDTVGMDEPCEEVVDALDEAMSAWHTASEEWDRYLDRLNYPEWKFDLKFQSALTDAENGIQAAEDALDDIYEPEQEAPEQES